MYVPFSPFTQAGHHFIPLPIRSYSKNLVNVYFMFCFNIFYSQKFLQEIWWHWIKKWNSSNAKQFYVYLKKTYYFMNSVKRKINIYLPHPPPPHLLRALVSIGLMPLVDCTQYVFCWQQRWHSSGPKFESPGAPWEHSPRPGNERFNSDSYFTVKKHSPGPVPVCVRVFSVRFWWKESNIYWNESCFHDRHFFLNA